MVVDLVNQYHKL